MNKSMTLGNIWMAVAVTIAVVTSYYGGSWLEGIAAVSNVVCVILVARRKLSNYAWGILGVITYGYLSFSAGYYGNGLLNVLYYLPLNIYGWWVWKKHLTEEQVDVADLTVSQKLLLLGIGIIGTVVVGASLTAAGGLNGYADAFTVVGSMIAMWLLVKRHREQWVVWMLVNIVTIGMWTDNYLSTGEGLALIGMWVVMLANTVYGWYEWKVALKAKRY